MKHGLVWTLVLAASLALFAVAAGFLLAVRPIVQGDVAGSAPVRVDIQTGASLGDVALLLHEAGVIRYPFVFKRYGSIAHYDRQIRAGEYEFVAGEPYRRILERLREGDIVQVKVTFPEGLTCAEVANTLQRRLRIPADEFLRLAQDSELLRRHNIDSPSFEGYLFPDTYYFPTKTTALQALEMMLQRFFTEWTPKHEERARGIGMTRGQVLTLASIVEGEVLLNSERRRVSAVYHNRLRRDMLLQADPTVLYALGGIRRRVLYSDLRVESPYNTYINRGLPPGPICNPGILSIEAALSPLEGNGELFFVAARDGTGRHVFTTNMDDHVAAKRHAELLALQRRKGSASRNGAVEDLSPAGGGESKGKPSAKRPERKGSTDSDSKSKSKPSQAP